MSPKILIVDDVSEILDIMAAIFEQAGAKVVTATRGDEVLDMVRLAQKMGEQFDMLIVDIRMPKMNGNELALKLRELPFDGPIIALTANYTVSGSSESKGSGITRYLSKETLSLDLAKALINEHCKAKV